VMLFLELGHNAVNNDCFDALCGHHDMAKIELMRLIDCKVGKRRVLICDDGSIVFSRAIVLGVELDGVKDLWRRLCFGSGFAARVEELSL
jgi:hypothetical protein